MFGKIGVLGSLTLHLQMIDYYQESLLGSNQQDAITNAAMHINDIAIFILYLSLYNKLILLLGLLSIAIPIL